MRKIFIAYRRRDSAYPVQAIYRELTTYFGPRSVVLDIDAIPLGTDFRKYLHDAVARCQVLLAVIGNNWLEWIRKSGFELIRVFADGFWDVPYIRFVPKSIKKLFFGSLGGFQAITGLVFLPMRWGESIMVIARKQ